MIGAYSDALGRKRQDAQNLDGYQRHTHRAWSDGVKNMRGFVATKNVSVHTVSIAYSRTGANTTQSSSRCTRT